MQLKSSQKYYTVIVTLIKGGTRTINVKASDEQTAGKRALKRTGAVRVHSIEEVKA